MRHSMGRITLFSIAVAEATRVQTAVDTRPTELVVRAVGKSLQSDPILGLPEAIGHIEVKIKRAERVGSF